jgi:hypothetical protein
MQWRDQRIELRARGFVRLGRVLDDATLAALRAAADRATAGLPPSSYGQIRHDPWRVEPAFERALRAGWLGAIACGLLDAPAVTVFQDHVISKTPGTQAEVAWHQDYGYWPLASARGLTVWVALDDTDETNGCLRYAPRSHEGGERAPADFTQGATQPLRAALPPIDPSTIVATESVPLAAGEAVVHDPLVLHMSPPNLSTRPRRAWSISLVDEDARWDPEHAPHPYTWALSPAAGAPLDPARFPRLNAQP